VGAGRGNTRQIDTVIDHLIMCFASTDPGNSSSGRRSQGVDGLGLGLHEVGRPTYIATHGIRWDSQCMKAYNTIQFQLKFIIGPIVKQE
jgi:hypothetical protein